MRLAAAMVVGLVVLGWAAPSDARRLFVARADSHVTVPGVSDVRALGLDPSALADLRASSDAVLEDFPLGDGSSATLALRRFSPFPAGARVEVMTPDGPRPMALPDAAYFTGTADGDPESRVLVVAGAGQAHGFVARGGDVHLFGPADGLRHRVYALRNVDPATYPRPTDFCVNDLRPDAVPAVPRPAPLPAVAAIGAARIAEIAIDTDNELRAKFASDQDELDWLGTLLAAATAIYERDVNVQLQFTYVRIWAPGVTDPWTATDTASALNEVQAHWDTPSNAVYSIARDVVHFISGKPVQGGIAYLDVLCNWYWAYGVSQVYGSFDLASPTDIWDVEVFTHELGHNFGSQHTHCYNPPLDMCYGSESGCYSGPAISSQGTIMSYCHLHPGGLANITLVFGPTVSARIGQSVAAASCLATVTTTTTTMPGGATTTSTTSAGATTTTSTSAAGSTTSTTVATSASTSTTTTTVPDDAGDGDADGDGVGDADDACPDTPNGDLVDARGCSVCPCDGPHEGSAWKTRSRYLRCMRTAIRRAVGRPGFDPRAAVRHAQKASCGRRGITRCCVDGATGPSCRLLKARTCAARSDAGVAEDLGAGSCVPSPCE